MSFSLILLAAALMTLSGLPALFFRRMFYGGQLAALLLCLAASATGLVGSLWYLATGAASVRFVLPQQLLGGGAALELDALGAFFLAPVFLISGLGALYAVGYWRQAERRYLGASFALFWALVTVGMILLILARQSLLFLIGWEVMALASFFLICLESANHEARRAAWIYLIATHVGTLCLLAMFGLLRLAAGSFVLAPLVPGQGGAGLLTAIFLLALAGFGVKAGVLPLHFWLPGAHANAPSHISAFLSGVIIKMGIYGLLRIYSLLPEPPLAWAGLLMALGAAGALCGVVFALAQHDLKRLLAYSSVENIGIILIGVGLAMAGRSLHRPDLIVLGLAGGLLHLWNHSLFKPLLFFGAGSVLRAAHTRQMDFLGGLGKRMPVTAGFFLLGSLAVCALPPLNGFISELLLYLGLLSGSVLAGLPTWMGAALAVPVLALTGALALACFVKLYGVVFLGSPRTRQAEGAHESPLTMLAPMALTAAGCLLLGLLPVLVAVPLDRVVAAWVPEAAVTLPKVAALSGLGWLSAAACVLLLALALGGWGVRFWLRRIPVARPGTWDCGYPALTPRVQYTSSSFSQMLTDWFRSILRPQVHAPAPGSFFAHPAGYRSHTGDPALDRVLLPLARLARWSFFRLHGLQQGLVHYYLIYILVAVILLLLWTLPIGALLTRLLMP